MDICVVSVAGALTLSDQFNICFSKRGKSDRTAALKKAIEEAVQQFEQDFGIANRAAVQISHSSPPQSGGLQAVDYVLWALQRFYEYAQTEKRVSVVSCRFRYRNIAWNISGKGISDED